MKNQTTTLSQTQMQVLHIVKEFLGELESERALRAVSLDASLESDLGIGSLERAELFRRIEKAFVIQLPDKLIAQAESISDIIPAIEAASPPGRVHYHEFFPHLAESHVEPSLYKTLVDILEAYATSEPERIHIYLQDETGKEKIIRYGMLHEKALATAKGLQALGLHPHETVAIMLPTCEQFFYAFFGILLAGGVPVPVYPPLRADRIEEYAKREARILHNAQVRILISFLEVERLNKILRNFIPSLKAVVTVDELQALDHSFTPYQAESTDHALIQYTSGSTGDPKGVLLTHDNLLANIRAIGEAIEIKPTDVAVSWLPLYHDMGLIGAWLGSFYFGIPITILSPLSFLNHPERWLWAIHYHQATLTAGPNFAYELCVSKIDDHAIEGLDLSSLRLGFNGAEAIAPKTLKNFTRRFAAYGLNPAALYPVYGLAESCVALTFPPLNQAFRTDKISRQAFNTEQRAVPATATDKNILEFVSCGKPLKGHEIKLMGPEGQVLGDREIGHLYFKGPSAMQGYYRHPKATQAIYHEGWWETGDLAYRAEGDIFITGRKKDSIIKAGRNLYPQEIEEITASVQGIRKGCVVAFGAMNPRQGTEQVIVVAETREQDSAQQEVITRQVIEQITACIGEPPDKVILVPQRTIPKTSSGKLKRSSTKELYLQGKLTRKTLPPWMQMLKLYLSSAAKKAMGWLGKLARVAYSVYVFFVFAITLLPTFALLFVLPVSAARKLTRFWTRNLARLAGCRILLKGEKHLTNDGPKIYVANHMSYIDTLVLAGILPEGTLIVGKKELSRIPILRKFMSKLGHPTVERIDFQESMTDANAVLAKLQAGNAILLFPEGTFSYAAGLRPFKLGAFKIATEANAPLIPIAIRGTRKIQRGTSLLLRPHRIHIWIGRPILPRSQDWREATRLRTLTRLEIGKHCGECLLNMVSAAPAKI